MLYVLSPILNAYIEKTNRQQFKYIIIALFLFQTLWGWMFMGSADMYQNGYSTLSFISLYLLARYVRLYKPRFCQLSRIQDFSIIIVLILIMTATYLLPIHLGVHTNKIGVRFINYISPLTILSALYFVIVFSKMQLTSSIVNWIAISCFAPFLIHMNPNLVYYYK